MGFVIECSEFPDIVIELFCKVQGRLSAEPFNVVVNFLLRLLV